MDCFENKCCLEEPVEIADEVRAEIDRLRAMKNFAGQSIADVMSNPDLPQAKRLALQERFFEPVYERLFKQDAEEKQKEQQQNRKRKKRDKNRRKKENEASRKIHSSKTKN